MVVVTGVLQKEAWDRDVMPPVERVRPGLWSIPVPIPDNPLRYVLVYAFELDNGVAIVDAGWNTDDAWMALNNGLVEAGGSIKDVQAVLVTHIHPDHYGLAGRVREESGAWIGLHPDDAEMLEARYIETDDLLARMREFLADAGVPATKLPDLNFASMMIRGQVTMAVPDVLFEDGKRVDVPGWDLKTVWTPGHSPGHVCFYSEQHRLLLSGDHVLPRITPNIGVHTQQFPNPLGEYLESLLKCQNLGVDEVLPAHEYRFADLRGRLDEIITHHADRLAEIEKLIDEHPGSTAWDISVALKWSRPWHEIADFMQRAAVGETLAHIVLLENHQRVRREGWLPVALLSPRTALRGELPSRSGRVVATGPRAPSPHLRRPGGGESRRATTDGHDDGAQDGQRVDPDGLGHRGVRRPGGVADQHEGRPPHDPARGVVGEEGPVAHAAHAREPGHERTGEGQPPAQEHRRPASPGQEVLAAVHAGLTPQGPVLDEPGTEQLADLVSHRVTDDGTHHDHRPA